MYENTKKFLLILMQVKYSLKNVSVQYILWKHYISSRLFLKNFVQATFEHLTFSHMYNYPVITFHIYILYVSQKKRVLKNRL